MLSPINGPAVHVMNPKVSPDVIRRHVQTILASANFDASVRNRKFLEFIVEETLAGNGERLKGYTIAIEVFDRDPSFDPQLDPVVRIEAGRLRRSLERYYLTEGKASAISVSIPKGKYLPQFVIRSQQPQERPYGAPTTPGDRVSLIVTPVFDAYTGPEDATFDMALLDEIVMGFHKKHPAIEIIVPPLRSIAAGSLPASPNTEYALRGSVRRAENGIRIIFHLTDHATGHLLLTQSFDQATTTLDIIATPQEIAAEIVGNVSAALNRARPGVTAIQGALNATSEEHRRSADEF